MSWPKGKDRSHSDTEEQYLTGYTRTVELGYNVFGLCSTLAIVLYILWYQLIPHKSHVFLPCLVRLTQEHVPWM